MFVYTHTNVVTETDHPVSLACSVTYLDVSQQNPPKPTAINDQEAQCYLNRYPDLQRQFGATNIAAAKTHWIQYGKNEKRDKSCPVSAMYFTALKDTADGKSAMIRSASIYDPSPAVCPLPLPLSLCISPCTPSRFPDFRSVSRHCMLD